MVMDGKEKIMINNVYVCMYIDVRISVFFILPMEFAIKSLEHPLTHDKSHNSKNRSMEQNRAQK